MKSSRRVVGVIGGGAIGVIAAAWLQRDGHEVFIVEPDELGAGASFGNAGCFNASSIVPLSIPGTLRAIPSWLLHPSSPFSIEWTYLPALAPWLFRFVRAGRLQLVKSQAQALRSLLRDPLAVFGPLLREAHAEDLVQHAGHLVVYRSEKSFFNDSLAWRLRRDNGVEFTQLDAQDLQRFDPNLSPDYVVGLVIKENGHTVNPHALLKRLAETFVRNGGRVIKAKARGFAILDDKFRGIETDAGMLRADCAIVAAGAHSAPLALAAGDSIPLVSQRGYHVMITQSDITPKIPTMDAEQKFIATPMQSGVRFAGTVELAGLTSSPNWRRAQAVLWHARRMLPGLTDEHCKDGISMWMGDRPCTPDSLPILGRSRRSDSIFYAFGHGHVGLTSAPMTGRIMADLFAGREPSINIAPFRASRFQNAFWRSDSKDSAPAFNS